MRLLATEGYIDSILITVHSQIKINSLKMPLFIQISG